VHVRTCIYGCVGEREGGPDTLNEPSAETKTQDADLSRDRETQTQT